MANIIVRNIPNTITCCNLISGCIATAYAFGGQPKMALTFIIPVSYTHLTLPTRDHV